MSRKITVSRSICPNTMVFEVHEMNRSRLTLLMNRTEAESLCDRLRELLDDPPTVLIPGPKLSIFPAPEEVPMKVIIVK